MRITKKSRSSIKAAKAAPWKKKANAKELQDRLYDAASEFLQSPEVGFDLSDVADYLFIDVDNIDDGVRIEVRCEVSYDTMQDLASLLNQIVQGYDKDSYFDDVDPGIIEAFIRNGSVMATTAVTASAEEYDVWLLDGDIGTWKLWGTSRRPAEDDHWDGFVDVVNDQRNTNYIDLKVLPKGSPAPTTKVEAADYGGAYDILPDQYFTKDDIMEFGYAVCDKLGKAYGTDLDIYDLDMKTPQDLYIELSAQDGEYQMAQTIHIDMRKIRKPSDLMKYVDQAAATFARDIEDIMNEVGVESPETAEDLANSYIGGADDTEALEDIDVEELPEVDPEEEEITDAEASATFSVDADVTVDEEGYWVFDDEDAMMREIDTSGLDAGLLYSEGGSEVAATSAIYEDLQKILETFVPGDPGTYRITCKATIVYERDGDVWELSMQKSKITGFRFSEA